MLILKLYLLTIPYWIQLCHGQLASLKNIDMTSYSKFAVPYLEEHNKTVDVNISLYILNIGHLNTEQMTFDVEIYLELVWKDPRLAFKTYNNASYVLVTGETAFKQIWVPDLFIRNMQQSKSSSFLNDLSGVTIRPDGTVELSSRMRTVSHCEMDLIMYPFDSQSCNLMMASYLYNTQVMTMHWGKSPVVIDKLRDGRKNKVDTFMGLSIKETKTKDEKHVYPITNVEYQYLIATFVLERKHQYYILRGFIPSSLLVFLTWASFWLPTSTIPARVALVITSFLASIVLYQGSTLHINQMTCMQIFLLGNIAFTGLTLLEFLLAIKVDQKKNQVNVVTNQPFKGKQKKEKENSTCDSYKKSNPVDQKARYIMPLLYLVFVGTFVIVVVLN